MPNPIPMKALVEIFAFIPRRERARLCLLNRQTARGVISAMNAERRKLFFLLPRILEHRDRMHLTRSGREMQRLQRLLCALKDEIDAMELRIEAEFVELTEQWHVVERLTLPANIPDEIRQLMARVDKANEEVHGLEQTIGRLKPHLLRALSLQPEGYCADRDWGGYARMPFDTKQMVEYGELAMKITRAHLRRAQLLAELSKTKPELERRIVCHLVTAHPPRHDKAAISFRIQLAKRIEALRPVLSHTERLHRQKLDAEKGLFELSRRDYDSITVTSQLGVEMGELLAHAKKKGGWCH